MNKEILKVCKMIHRILLFKEDNSILYSWKSNLSSLNVSNDKMMLEIFESINNVLSEVFEDRLQRIFLEDRVLIITGKEFVYENDNNNFLLLVITADINDNKTLINKLAGKILTISLAELVKNNDLSGSNLKSTFDELCKKNIYHRSQNKILISIVLTFFSVIFASIISSLNLNSNLTPFILGIITAYLLITLSTSLAGTRKDSIIVGLFSSILGSIIAFILIQYIILEPVVGSVGIPIIFFGFTLFIGFVSGLTGGSIIERYFLT